MTYLSVPPITRWAELDAAQRRELLQRPAQAAESQTVTRVQGILQQVRAEGDAALQRLTAQFDRVELPTPRLTPGQVEVQAARVPAEVRAAIDAAYDNIYAFHAAQQPRPVTVETQPGVICELRYAPLQRVGLYIPGGSAVLPSSVLMLGIPAALAGCQHLVLCSPPGADGLLSPAVCYAATKVGVTDVVAVGGAQAVAALAYGTESVPRVDKIFGPGNAYVTAAKTLVSSEAGGPAIDMPAGPSELLIVADKTADAAFLAADLLSQAEHGADSQVILVSSSAAVLEATCHELARQLDRLPRRDIAARALTACRLILTGSLDEAIKVADDYAPEHLSLQTERAAEQAGQIRAGSVFVGHYAPVAGGDYATGTNHVLPTYGAARASSSLGLHDFLRRYTVQTLSHSGLKALAPTVTALAREEGLEAHARAIEARLNL
ncbi:histidinol dehydrogenase [Deinococcus radiophilus]|uniref:Histidinol dehydrogenase n=1 Tax=Deinococcus radiophilus TaxID=32062 RepID=A0A3S0JNC5_9DEIO|nr:histidinol dehydrogenase [Deinococcus radiophilus]RTR25581.1 histidinol dehydrogenase [Deinococcus radiophilus]UFA51455.1 histidinol dehydrogenase [Deinococcus radiophilus]